MKVGDLVVFAESVAGIVLECDVVGDSESPREIWIRVLLADADHSEWVEAEGLRVIS